MKEHFSFCGEDIQNPKRTFKKLDLPLEHPSRGGLPGSDLWLCEPSLSSNSPEYKGTVPI